MTNKEAADILRLMPKQSEAIKKAIEVLERTKWHTNPPTEEGEYLVVCKYMRFVEMAKYSKNLYKVDKYDFPNKKRAGWYKYDSECGFYEIRDVIAWTYFPVYEGNENYRQIQTDKEKTK